MVEGVVACGRRFRKKIVRPVSRNRAHGRRPCMRKTWIVPLAAVSLLVSAAALGVAKASPDERAAVAHLVRRTRPALPSVPLVRQGEDVARSSGLLLAKIGERPVAIVLDADDAAIVEVDARDGTPLARTLVGSAPATGLLLGDGTLAVAHPEEHAVVVYARHVDGQRYREVRRIPTSDDPRALALSPDEASLYVTCGASHTLLAFDARSGRELGRVELPREPRGMVVSRDGRTIYVAHAAYDATSVVHRAALVAGDAKVHEVVHGAGSGACEAGSGGEQAMCKSELSRHGNALVATLDERDGKVTEHVFAPVAMVRPRPRSFFVASKLTAMPRARNVPSIQGDGDFPMEPMGGGGGGVTGYGTTAESGAPVHFEAREVSVSMSDGVTTGRSVLVGGGSAFNDPTRCDLPVAAVAPASKGLALVACAGTKRVEVVPLPSANGLSLSGPSARRSIEVGGSPSALALAPGGDKVYVYSQATRHLSVHLVTPRSTMREVEKTLFVTDFDVPPLKVKVPELALLDGKVLDVALARKLPREEAWIEGRDLFFSTFDPRISKDGRACASCHVDGLDDGIVWATPDGKRRTRTLAGQLGSGPYGWRGEHKTLADHIKVTERQLGGTGLSDADLGKLVTYVSSLGAPPRTRPAVPDPLAKRGAEVFASAKYDCATCHTGGGVESDREAHDVGSGGKFVTPSLAGIATRPSFFHDGAYTTLDEMLKKAKDMGRTSEMPEDDRKAVLAYLGTL